MLAEEVKTVAPGVPVQGHDPLVTQGSGTRVTSKVPMKEVPCFVRPGTILPLSPVVQHSGEIGQGPLQVYVFGGSDGHFTLVEDDGWSTKYQQGDIRSTNFKWADHDQTPCLAGASAEAFQGRTGSHGCMVAALVAMAAGALIVQNKGGGHGEIGYHLALKLAKEKGLKVTMIQDSACKQDKPPFNSYSDLTQAGVEIKMADLQNGGLSTAIQGVPPCEYVFDNQNICPKDVQNLVKSWNPKVYAYVSSGGMYLAVPQGPLIEGGGVKLDNKQLANENHARNLGINWCAFRPQYIYGPKTNKRDYIDWFLDRITRDLPFPLPKDGTLFTTLTNSEDVAGMMASVVGKEAEATSTNGQIFNCAGDELLSHVDVVKLSVYFVNIYGHITQSPILAFSNEGSFTFQAANEVFK
eukprot:g26037.t1